MKTHGTRHTTKTANEPPTTHAAHRRAFARPASGIRSSAASAIAPVRTKSSGVTQKWSTVPSS